jgi:hypothetical protein
MLPYAHGVFVGADPRIRPQSKNQPKRIHNPLFTYRGVAVFGEFAVPGSIWMIKK